MHIWLFPIIPYPAYAVEHPESATVRMYMISVTYYVCRCAGAQVAADHPLVSSHVTHSYQWHILFGPASASASQAAAAQLPLLTNTTVRRHCTTVAAACETAKRAPLSPPAHRDTDTPHPPPPTASARMNYANAAHSRPSRILLVIMCCALHIRNHTFIIATICLKTLFYKQNM